MSHLVNSGGFISGQRYGREFLIEPLDSRFLLAFAALLDLSEGPTSGNYFPEENNGRPWTHTQTAAMMRAQDPTGANPFLYWFTDGTVAGTEPLSQSYINNLFPPTADIYGGFASTPTSIFFPLNRGENVLGLGATDGTVASTRLLKVFPSFGASSTSTRGMGAIGDAAYLLESGSGGTVGNGQARQRLWKSDGTESGTTLAADFVVSNSEGNDSELVQVGNNLIWRAGNPTASVIRRYSASDDIIVSLGSSNVFPDGEELTAFDSFPALFSARASSASAENFELWMTDGTPGGATLFREINPNSTVGSRPTQFVRLGTQTFFTADDGAHGRELWLTDGTFAGTRLVKDIRLGSIGANPLNVTKFGNFVYFSASNGSVGRELWRSDGTEAGTVLVKDVLPGVGSGLYPPSYSRAQWQILGDKLYFPGDDGVTGRELWATDGTAAGTQLVADITPGTPSNVYSSPEQLTTVGNTLIFTAEHPSYGRELWRYSIPFARAAGPYSTVEGQGVQLNGANSLDPDGLPLNYSWDVNGDGTFGDATGAAPSLSWSQLQALGFNDGPSTPSSVRVRVTNTIGDVSTSQPTTITITDTPPSVVISGNSAVLESATYTLNLSATDPGADQVTSWQITWQPGVTETLAGNPASVQHTYTVEGDYTITGTATNEDGTFASNAVAVMVGVPPRVTSSGFAFEQSHGVTTQFSEAVGASLTLADTTLFNLTQGFQLNAAVIGLTYNTSNDKATFTFPGVPNARLIDGNYRMTIAAAGVTDAAGRLLDGDNNGSAGGDFVFDFFVLTGDATRDRSVNLDDFTSLAANFGLTGRVFSQGDFNYSGTVNLDDFTILAGQFGSSLPPATGTSSRVAPPVAPRSPVGTGTTGRVGGSMLDAGSGGIEFGRIDRQRAVFSELLLEEHAV